MLDDSDSDCCVIYMCVRFHKINQRCAHSTQKVVTIVVGETFENVFLKQRDRLHQPFDYRVNIMRKLFSF